METADKRIIVGTVLKSKKNNRLYPVVKVHDNGDVDVLGDNLLPNRLTKENMEEFDIDKIFQKKDTEEKVDHPKHYNREGAMECIDEMVLLFGKEAVMTFCKLNAWKYRYRASEKNGKEDIEKADWYIQMYKKLATQFTYE